MFYKKYGKRVLDVLAVVALAIPAVLILAAIYPVHRRKAGPGEFLFKQQRVGQGGSVFTIYKVRTMSYDGETTPFTQFLRRTSIDELPQLANVAAGEMSLVGVRPEVWEKAARNGIVMHPRHKVRPGLTGAVQITALRLNEIHDPAVLEVDTTYVQGESFFTDLGILLKTPVALTRGETT